MNQNHTEILAEIKKEAKNVDPNRLAFQNFATYIGTDHPSYRLSIPVIRTIAKTWAKNHADISAEDFVSVLNSLFSAESHEEKEIAGKLLEYLPKQTQKLHPVLLNSWITHLEGWAEVDSMCGGIQQTITPETFPKWKILIEKLRTEKQIEKRRTALVLLTGPVGKYSNKDFADCAFKTITILMHEKNILITKAISWLLRSLVKNYRMMVEDFLHKHINEIPKIALRETRIKLEHGIKNYRKP